MPTVNAGSATRIFNEFLVNSNPDDFGGQITVAGQANGQFLIAWTGLLNGSDEGDDSNSSDVIARSFLSGGRPITSDFRINTETRDSQDSPVATGLNGTYAIAYSSGDENRLPGTFAASQVLRADGNLVGSEQFNARSDYNYAPAITGLGSGGYVVTASLEVDFDTQFRAPDGTGLADFRFGGFASTGISSVTATGTDSVQFFWLGLPSPDSTGSEDEFGFYTQSATAAGTTGAPIRLLPDTTSLRTATLANGDLVVGGYIFDVDTQRIVGGAPHQGAIAALDDGGFVTVTTANDADGTGIVGQVYNGDGTARGASFLINETVAGDQRAPDVAAIGNDDFVVSWQGTDGIKAAVFSADAVAADDAILVNTTVANQQNDPAVARLDNGGFVVVWHDESQFATQNLDDIRGQVFDATGGKVGAEFLVNATQVGNDYQPVVTATRDGGFSVAWIHGEDDLVPPPAPALQHFTAIGQKVGPEIDIPSGFAGATNIAAIGGGRTVVTYKDIDSETGIFGAVLKANGTQAASFFIDDKYSRSDYDIVGLKGGGFVVAYAAPDEAFNDEPRKIHLATYAATGALVSDRVAAQPDGVDHFNPSIAALDGNGYVLTWSSSDGASGTDFAQVYRGDGTKLGSVIEVGAQSGSSDVAALADGRFVVSWTTGSGGAESLHSQVYTLEGDKSGAEGIKVIEPNAFGAVAVSGYGEHGYVVTYAGEGPGSDGSGSAIRAQLYTTDNQINGTPAGETLSGTDAGDTVHAGIGNDVVNASGGNDLVYAEGGVDTVHGGDGDDVIYGGGQYDFLYGDAGRDTIVGESANISSGSRAGHDTIDAGADADTVYGDAYSISAGGFGGRDTIAGGDGDDRIWGDARTLEAGSTGGNDRIDGGSGADIIYGDAEFASGAIGGNDRIDGGAGNDSLWGGGGNDLFVFSTPNFGNDVIHDFGQVAGNRDLIDLRGLGLSFDQLQINYTDAEAIVEAPFTSEGKIELLGVHSLAASDFLF